jgi:hypothetical protein
MNRDPLQPDVEPVLEEATPAFEAGVELQPVPEPDPELQLEAAPEPEPEPGPEPDQSDLVNEVMARFGTPSWEAWATPVPDLIKKLEG